MNWVANALWWPLWEFTNFTQIECRYEHEHPLDINKADKNRNPDSFEIRVLMRAPGYPGSPERCTSEFQSKLSWKLAGGTKAALPWAH